MCTLRFLAVLVRRTTFVSRWAQLHDCAAGPPPDMVLAIWRLFWDRGQLEDSSGGAAAGAIATYAHHANTQ